MKKTLEKLGIKNLTQLQGFHNQIFQGLYEEKEIVIRISERRPLEDIQEEVSILNTIKEEVSIACPTKVNGFYVIKYEDKVISFYEKVDGLNWHETTLTDDTHFEAGKELGKLHLAFANITKTSRASYKDHPDIALLRDTKELYRKELKQTLNKLASREPSKKEYGLIHGDYLFSNLLYHDQSVTIIDFDDMEYNYYLYDIAVYLFYLLLGGDPSHIDVASNIDIFTSFIKGYRSVNQETLLDFTNIQALFRLRQLKLLATITTKIDPANYGDWQKNYLNLCEQQFINNDPFVHIPYEKLYKNIINKEKK